jgi:ABC-type multidrug transport system fused ATPase/permease subunit
VVAAGIVGYGIFTYAALMLSHIAAYHILYETRMKIIRKMTRLPLGFFTRRNSGEFRQADKIAVINQGVVVEEGMHAVKQQTVPVALGRAATGERLEILIILIQVAAYSFTIRFVLP